MMHFWCMWPARAFQKLNSEFKYPIILTSGTLFPLETYKLELGNENYKLFINSHIVDEKNIFARIVTHSKDNRTVFEGNFKNRSNIN